MLLDLDDNEIMSMFKDLGIDAWGDWRKIKKAVENVRLRESSIEMDNNRVVANDEHILDATCVNIVRKILAEDALFQCAILNKTSRILFLTMNYIESIEKEILVAGS